MSSRHIVLRAIQGAFTGGPFNLLDPFARPRVASTEPPEIVVDVASLTAREILDAARDPGVVAITPVMPTRLIAPVAGAAAATAWGIKATGAAESSYQGNGVTVAILDTGIDAKHPAFQGVTLVQKDFSGSGNGDVVGHGTHCAGTVFGRDAQGTRIGVAPAVPRALIGKVLGDDGGGSSEALFQAIQWALTEGAKVVSMSLGFDFPGMARSLADQGWPIDLATSAALEAYRANFRAFEALMSLARARQAFDGGAVIVAASGNESHREVNPDYEIGASLPAAADGVLSVGAAQRSGNQLTITDFSNTLCEISGPGLDVLSAKAGGGLVSMSGTSMATPHVAGAAALWWEAIAKQGLPVTATMVIAKLRATASTSVFAPGVDVADRGAGLVQAPK